MLLTLFQLAYNPLETPLIKQMRAKKQQGWIVVDGLQILPEQAVPQFELFTGREAPKKLMQSVALKAYEEQQRNVTIESSSI